MKSQTRIVFVLFVLCSILVAQCAPQVPATPERVVETQIVVATQQVEVEVVVTATPAPTSGEVKVLLIGKPDEDSIDPITGKEIWRASYADGFSNVPRPVFGHGLVYIATGFQEPSLMAVRPDGLGDVTKTHVAWQLRRGAPLTPSPILVGDELYVVNDLGIVSCVEAVMPQLSRSNSVRGR